MSENSETFTTEQVSPNASNSEVIEEVYTQSAKSWELEELLNQALSAKEEGNNYYRDKEYDLAIQSYSQAISYCPDNQENKENLVQ